MTLSLKNKFLLLTGFMVSVLSLNMGSNYYWEKRLDASLKEMQVNNQISIDSAISDMYHDAIRSDVYRALDKIRTNRLGDIGEILEESREHIDKFHGLHKKIKETTSSQVTRDVFQSLVVHDKEYTNLAEKIIKDAKTGAVEQVSIDQFLEKFEYLEGALEKATENIKKGYLESNEAFDKDLASRDLIALISSIILMLTMVMMAAFTIQSILKPLLRNVAKMHDLAGGKDIKIEDINRGDEVGLMSKALAVFKAHGEEVAHMRANEAAIAQKQHDTIKAEMLALSDVLDREVQTIVAQVSTKTKTMLDNVTDMTQSSERVSMEASRVDHASKEATQNVESVAAAAEELALSVQEISRQVSQAARIAQEAVGTAEITNTTVRDLSEAAGRIGDVVKLISDIANQTNLLALNATIEAARAGEAGKGFAVVASEVKNLASQTTRATEEISGQISGIQGATLQAVNAIDAISSTIQQIDQISSSIAAAVEEQGAATNEISRNTQQAAAGTRQVSSSISDVSRESSHNGEISGVVRALTVEMATSIEDLQGRLQKILRESAAGDRRRMERHEDTNMTASIKCNGRTYSLKVKNISSGGMAVEGKIEGASSRNPLEIMIPNFQTILFGNIEGINKDMTRIKFTANESLEKELDKFLSLGSLHTTRKLA